MADEKPEQTPSAKGKQAPASRVLVARLVSANAGDEFRVGHPDEPDKQLVITPAGVQIDPDDVEPLIEVANANGVTILIGQEDAK
jgi:hypothetical protein